jgi:hypothetical protein
MINPQARATKATSVMSFLRKKPNQNNETT